MRDYLAEATKKVNSSPALRPYANILLRDGWHPAHFKNLSSARVSDVLKWIEEYKAFQRWIDEKTS